VSYTCGSWSNDSFGGPTLSLVLVLRRKNTKRSQYPRCKLRLPGCNNIYSIVGICILYTIKFQFGIANEEILQPPVLPFTSCQRLDHTGWLHPTVVRCPRLHSPIMRPRLCHADSSYAAHPQLK